jgi:hypothetical protein
LGVKSTGQLGVKSTGQFDVKQGRTGGNGLHVEPEHGEHGLQAYTAQVRAKGKSEAEGVDDTATSKQKEKGR